jgi:hypothetical protein
MLYTVPADPLQVFRLMVDSGSDWQRQLHIRSFILLPSHCFHVGIGPEGRNLDSRPSSTASPTTAGTDEALALSRFLASLSLSKMYLTVPATATASRPARATPITHRMTRSLIVLRNVPLSHMRRSQHSFGSWFLRARSQRAQPGRPILTLRPEADPPTEDAADDRRTVRGRVSRAVCGCAKERPP